TDGRLLRIAHHRSSECGYWVQPRPTLSGNGRFVTFASDWAAETGQDGCDNPNNYPFGRGDAFILDLEMESQPPPAFDNFLYLPIATR
ncbi:MAG: hypothetical protein AAF614_20995, partial [Chloroflexota bacterium]